MLIKDAVNSQTDDQLQICVRSKIIFDSEFSLALNFQTKGIMWITQPCQCNLHWKVLDFPVCLVTIIIIIIIIIIIFMIKLVIFKFNSRCEGNMLA